MLAPGDPDLLAWIADALPHADYLLPDDEQVRGFTAATDLASGLGTDAGVYDLAAVEAFMASTPTR